MEEDQITTILLTGPDDSRKWVFRKLAQKRLPKDKRPFSPAAGTYTYMEERYRVLELPVSSWLMGHASAAVVICDALFLEQGLDHLAQLIRLEPVKQKGLPLLLCICNCKDAQEEGIWIDYDLLEDVLQIPVLPLDRLAPSERDDLKAAIAYANKRRFSYDLLDFFPKKLAEETTHHTKAAYGPLEDKMDHLLTSPVLGSCFLALLFFLMTMPVLAGLSLLFGPLKGSLDWLLGPLSTGSFFLEDVFHIPSWLMDILVYGVLSPLICVLFVMLPPLALCLPLFFFLEETGLLPRAAFSADKLFSRCGGCGQQCLAMSMGFCCRQAGIWRCRSIQPGMPSRPIGCSTQDMPQATDTRYTGTKEKMVSLLTTSFLPCSGQMPALVLFSFLLFPDHSFFFSAIFLSGLLLLGIAAALCSTFLFTHTVLHRFPSVFFLVLPPIRRPRLWKRVLPAAFDHTCLFLGRAAAMAVFAGLLLWAMAHLFIRGSSLLSISTAALDPFGRLLGLDGTILMAFLLSAPADELMLPIMFMLYQGQNDALSISSFSDLSLLLAANGWTWQTALSVSLFTLFHWPCASTLAAIRQETGQLKWALAAFFLPTLWGTALCTGLTLLIRSGM